MLKFLECRQQIRYRPAPSSSRHTSTTSLSQRRAASSSFSRAVSQKHVAEFFALLGGGVKEPGWLNTQLSKSRLAVVTAYSHYNFITSAEVPQIIGKFLADPLTNPPAGAAAASQAALPPEKKQ
jgi:hypothetical protein